MRGEKLAGSKSSSMLVATCSATPAPEEHDMSLPPVSTHSPARQHPRVDADLVARLHLGEREVLARVADISLAGLAVHDPAGELSRGFVDRVALRIPGQGEIVLRVRLVRRDGERVALTFSELDWDDLFILARYLSPRL
jgi:hypothetical protein